MTMSAVSQHLGLVTTIFLAIFYGSVPHAGIICKADYPCIY